MKMKSKVCLYCKKDFEYKNDVQKFCTTLCKAKYSADTTIIKVKKEKKVYSTEFFDWRDYDFI
jgi:hypothetical protein